MDPCGLNQINKYNSFHTFIFGRWHYQSLPQYTEREAKHMFSAVHCCHTEAKVVDLIISVFCVILHVFYGILTFFYITFDALQMRLIVTDVVVTITKFSISFLSYASVGPGREWKLRDRDGTGSGSYGSGTGAGLTTAAPGLEREWQQRERDGIGNNVPVPWKTLDGTRAFIYPVRYVQLFWTKINETK